jgi:CubicO group peptidase (beta-lactamase class C family)
LAPLCLSLATGCAPRAQARAPAIAPTPPAIPLVLAGKTAIEERLVPIDGPRGAPTTFATLARRMAHYDVPGVSIAVVHEGRIAWSAGYGALKAGELARVDEKTLFQAASISKPIADLATLVLVQKGTLDLDTDVNRYLKSWRVPESELTKEHPVTLRGIMSHTAGFNVHGFSGYRPEKSVPTLVQILEGAPPANSEAIRIEEIPSTRYSYSGGGLTVMEAVLVDVSQRSFEDLLQESVLRPLGMTRSTFAQPLPPLLEANAARAHDKQGAPENYPWHVMPMLAAAGLWTTSTDLAQVIIEVQRAYSGQSSRILNQASARAMLTRVPPSPAGLGFFLSGEGDAKVFIHNGSNPGYASLIHGYVERGEGVVVLANGGRAELLRREIVDALTRDLDWPAKTGAAIFADGDLPVSVERAASTVAAF